MGLPDRERNLYVFRNYRSGHWASVYRNILSWRSSALTHTFSGVPTGKCNFCGDWRSPHGRYSSCVACEKLFGPGDSQAAKDTNTSQDKLIDVFNRFEHFFRRLEIYTVLTPTAAMTDMIVEIMVEVLTILAIATKEVKRGLLSELISCLITLLS